jgi:hypothetical protein
MAVAPQSPMKAFLQGLAWVLFVIAGLAVVVAGSAISDFWKVDRTLAEVVGDSLALLIAGLGYILKSIAGDLGETEDSSGVNE